MCQNCQKDQESPGNVLVGVDQTFVDWAHRIADQRSIGTEKERFYEGIDEFLKKGPKETA